MVRLTVVRRSLMLEATRKVLKFTLWVTARAITL